MNGMKWRQIKYKLTHDYLSVENVALSVAVILCLTWTYNSVVSMSKNWELMERLSAEQKTLELKKIDVETAELENEYYKSAEYQELAARKLLNKQLDGEHMVYLPENSEAAKNKHKTKEVVEEVPETEELSNFEKWMRYLFP